MINNILAEETLNPTLFHCMFFFIVTIYCSAISAKNNEFNFVTDKESYQYSVIQAGDNYNFKFKKNLVDEAIKLKAGHHVLQSVYKDSSINKKHTDAYIKERARCYVFDSSLHTYTLCFLPNEFSHNKKDQLRGFVTQLPNWKWLATRFLLPFVLIYALIFYFTKKRD